MAEMDSIKKAPFNGDFGCVGQKGVLYMKIQYWVVAKYAEEIQKEMIKTDKAAQYKKFCYEPWFSPCDFDDLLKTLKQSYDMYDVCIYAQQGNGYFSYSNTQSGVGQPLVEVTLYQAGVNYGVDKGMLSVMNERWGGAFCVFPGPLVEIPGTSC